MTLTLTFIPPPNKHLRREAALSEVMSQANSAAKWRVCVFVFTDKFGGSLFDPYLITIKSLFDHYLIPI